MTLQLEKTRGKVEPVASQAPPAISNPLAQDTHDVDTLLAREGTEFLPPASSLTSVPSSCLGSSTPSLSGIFSDGIIYPPTSPSRQSPVAHIIERRSKRKSPTLYLESTADDLAKRTRATPVCCILPFIYTRKLPISSHSRNIVKSFLI